MTQPLDINDLRQKASKGFQQLSQNTALSPQTIAQLFYPDIAEIYLTNVTQTNKKPDKVFTAKITPHLIQIKETKNTIKTQFDYNVDTNTWFVNSKKETDPANQEKLFNYLKKIAENVQSKKIHVFTTKKTK